MLSKKKNLLILTQASYETGFGHLKRCIFLSKKLKKYFKIYYIKKNISKKFLPKEYNILNYKNFTKNEKLKFSTLLIDLKKIDIDHVKLIKNLNIANKIIISDKIEKKLKPNISIIPYILKKNYNNKKIISGIDSLIFDEKLKIRSKPKKVKKNYKVISICMGGSDPKNLTTRLIKDLIQINIKRIKFNIIVGPLFKSILIKRLKKIIRDYKNFTFYKDPKNFYTILKRSDLGIINSGNIKYELVALGVPFLLLSNDIRAKKFCIYFANYFKCFYSYNFQYPTKFYIKNLLQKLIKNYKEFKLYSDFNQKMIDLHSVDKIAKHINNTNK